MEKIIYFEPFKPCLDIIACWQILYPVCVFDVAFQEKKSSFDDIFCETVYETIKNVTSDETKVAEFLALNINFVRFVKQRLIQNRYLDYDGNIINNVRKAKASDESYSYSYGKIVVDGINGKILHFIKDIDRFDYEEPSRVNLEKRTVLAFNVGSAGLSNEIRIYKQIYFDKELRVKTPSVFDVRRIAKKTYMNGDVSISQNSQRAYLCLDIMLQNGYSDDVLVTDGFGESYASPHISDFINRQNWINEFKTKALTRHSKTGNSESNSEGTSFDKYHSIFKKLNKFDFLPATTQAEQLKREKKLTEKTSDLFDVIEEVLRLINQEFPADKVEILALESNNNEKNQYTLTNIAMNIGIEVYDSTSYLLKVDTQKICKPSELRSLFSYALIAAKNDSRHPLNNLAKRNKGILSYLYELKTKRDSIEHNAGQVVTLNEFEILREQTEQVVCGLLKDYEINVTEQVEQSFSDINNAELKAITDLERDLGVINCRILKEKHNDIFKELKILYNPKYIPDPSDYAKIAQSELEILRDNLLRASDINHSKCKYIALKKIDACLGEIPQSLKTVREKFVDSAVRGKNTTLGGIFLAIFYLADNEMINNLNEKVSSIIENTARLCVLRGHNNWASLDEQAELKQTLRLFLINLTKYILEE